MGLERIEQIEGVLVFKPAVHKGVSQRTTLIHGVMVEVRGGHDRHHALERGRGARRQRVLSHPQRRSPERADVAVAPPLPRDPLDRCPSVGPFVDVAGVLPARIAAPAFILADAGIPPEVEEVACIPDGVLAFSVWCALEDHRPWPEAGANRKVHVGGEERAVRSWHGHGERLRCGSRGNCRREGGHSETAKR